MKRKLLALLLTAVLCLSLTVPCFAAAGESTPSVQVMYTEFDTNSVGGISPTIFYRNNSGKEIKYIYWYLSALNAVGDPEKSINGSTEIVARSVGPIAPFVVDPNKRLSNTVETDKNAPLDSPFRTYTTGGYFISANGGKHIIRFDKFGNPYSFNGTSLIAWSTSEYIYLTDDEATNALFQQNETFEIAWYSRQVKSIRVNKAIIEYMDGSKETISGSKINSPYMNKPLSNQPYEKLLSQYSSVYNYKEYMAYNADIASVYGDNQWKLFQHFVNSGMKEGRQGSSEFNLAAYKANNPDLVAIFGDDNAKYYEHYISSGKAEGRKAV